MDSFIPAGQDTDGLSHHTEKEEHLHLRWMWPNEHCGHQTRLGWHRCETELRLQAVELISVGTRSVECLFFPPSASLHLVFNWLGRTCRLYHSKICAHLTLNKRAETHPCEMFCIFTHLSVYRKPWGAFFLFMMMFELVSSQKLKIWYFFAHLLTSAFSSISHGLKQ